MSKFLDILDKYKFGLLAMLGTYIAIFMYLQLKSFTEYFPIDPFHEGSVVEVPEDDIKLRPENIIVPQGFNEEVKSLSRDANDTRDKSYEEYYQNQSVEQIEEDLKKLEEQMREETGGEQKRAVILEEMEKRKNALADKKNVDASNKTGDKAYAGNVMVDWSLPSRDAHQKNNWFVRNPGYTCGYGATGMVTIMIKVNQNGNVTSASYDESQSSGASSCMITQAMKYAKMSRFSYSGSAPKLQAGRITYTFISQ